MRSDIAEPSVKGPGVAPAPARGRRGIGPALLTVEELTQIRSSLIRRLAIVQGAIDEHVERRRAESSAKARSIP